MIRRVVVAACIVGLAAGVYLSAARLERTGEDRDGEHLLYLPNGKYLRLMSLGHSSLVADFLYLWAIQYYSNYEREDRFRYVRHVFGDVIGELDPHFIDPYWLGALILVVEADDLEAGLGLLDRGFEHNPEAWILPYLGAWELYRAGDYVRAARWFDRAAAVPGAPPAAVRMRAAMFNKAGDLRESIRMWRAVLEEPGADASSTAIAQRQIRDLQVRLDLQTIEAAVDAFRKDNGRGPRRLEDLTAGAYLDHLPRDPDDRPYHYDPATGRVTSAAGRVLGGA